MKSWIEKFGFRTGATLMILAFCAFCLGCAAGSEKTDPGQEGQKEVFIEIIGRDGSMLLEDTVRTDAESLGDLLDDQGLIGYDKTGLGRFITEMGGEKADPAAEYWSIWVNGSYGQYGADKQPIQDGDRFTFKLVTY